MLCRRDTWRLKLVPFFFIAACNCFFLLKCEAVAQPSSEEWIKKIDAALEKPAAKLLPAVMVFPVTDEEYEICDGGYAMGLQANAFCCFAPNRKTNGSFFAIHKCLANGGFDRVGVKIDEQAIQIYQKSVGAERYYLPQLVQSENGATFTLEKIESGSVQGDDILTAELTVEEFTQIPGKIALAVYQDLGAELSSEERAYIEKPQFGSAEEYSEMDQYLKSAAHQYNGDDLEAFLRKQPNCLVGWLALVVHADQNEYAFQLFQRYQSEVPARALIDLYARRYLGFTETQFNNYLEQSSVYRSDVLYFNAIIRYFVRQYDIEVVSHLLQKWEEIQPGYYPSIVRAAVLIDLAWMVRGGGFASQVGEENMRVYSQLMLNSQAYNQAALEQNPAGWLGYMQEIRYATEVLSDPEYARDAFDACVSLAPRCEHAYQLRFRSLQLRWGGNPSELLLFAQQCVETGLWDTSIPGMAIKAIYDLGDPQFSFGFVRQIFKDPRVWEIYSNYSSGMLAARPGRKQKINSLSEYAKNGAYGRHYAEVEPVFRKLDDLGYANNIFGDSFTKDYLRDLVYSNTASGLEQNFCALRVAINESELEQASEILEQLKKMIKTQNEALQRYRKQIEYGQKYQQDKSIALLPQNILDLFEGDVQDWRIDGEKLICDLPPHSQSQIFCPIGFLNYEFKGDMEWDENTSWVKMHLHTRGMRDLVEVKYDCPNNLVGCYRNNVLVANSEQNKKKIFFQYFVTPKDDVVRSAGNIEWRINTYEPVPTGFGFTVQSGDKPTSVYVKKMSLKYFTYGN